MSLDTILIVTHDSHLRVVTEAEALSTLTAQELARPRRIERIDTRHLKDDVDGGHWRSSHLYLRGEAARIRDLADNLGATDVRYMGVAEVPHVLALGAYMGDERLIQVCDYDRDRSLWQWPSTEGTLTLAVENPVSDQIAQAGDAVLRVEISYPILDADIDAAIGKERLSNIRIVPQGGPPAPGLVRSADDVSRVRLKVREALAALASARPSADLIHLFIAAPVSVCLAVGQELRLRNGKAVQTYRYRSGSDDRALTPAILLTSGDVNERAKPMSAEDIQRAQALRAVWQLALEDVRQHARTIAARITDGSAAWYEHLQPRETLRLTAPFPGLRPMRELIEDDDRVAPAPSVDEFEFDKDARDWRLSDELVLGMFEAAGRDESRLREHARLFFWHEYVHDGQGLTAYTSVDVGRLANCLERVDYLADVYAVLHQVDFLVTQQSGPGPDDRLYRELLLSQIELALRSFWSFESPPPLTELQERRLRRYLNWYWRRVQLRESRDVRSALALLAQQPCIEISGLRRRLGGDRIYVALQDPGGFQRLHIGIVLEDGRLRRFGSSTDASIEELLRAFSQHDHVAIERFFSALIEHVK
jgi:hypothetical protein